MGATVQHVFLYLLALGAGVSVATQQVLNGSLRTALGSPAWAGLISYAGGLITMIVAVIALRERVPSWKTVVDVPWCAWSGGVFVRLDAACNRRCAAGRRGAADCRCRFDQGLSVGRLRSKDSSPRCRVCP
jgi:hypothetical protein